MLHVRSLISDHPLHFNDSVNRAAETGIGARGVGRQTETERVADGGHAQLVDGAPEVLHAIVK